MGLLLLLTSTLLASYFQSGKVVNAQQFFTIASVTLSIEPQADVPRNTNVTIRCKAKVFILGSEALTRRYVIYKDNKIVNSKNTSSSEDYLYHLLNARVSNNGKYKCQINIDDQHMTSETEKLTVTGLSKPVLHLTKSAFIEGEEVLVSCSAPEETGSILVYFYDNSKEILEMQMNSHPAEAKISLMGPGIHEIHCSYTVHLMPDSVKSEESNRIPVTVREFSITPVLEVSPKNNIYEGDPLTITCTIRNFLPTSQSINLILSEGTRMLDHGGSSINHNMTAPASVTSLTFECMLTVKNVKKVDTKTVSVAELFSRPTLTMSPPEVFRNDPMKLICRSEKVATEKLDRTELTYTLHSLEMTFLPRDRLNTGVFSIKAPLNDFNCTCVAQARNIEKSSKILAVRPKVLVSTPTISVDGRVILGQPFQIRCQSFNGSVPIIYTLYKDQEQIDKTTIEEPDEGALFTVSISRTDELNEYTCKANNKGRDVLVSKALNATVIVPLSQVILTTVPDLQELSEGSNLHLLCTVKGTPPITFKWYRVGNSQPLHTTTSKKNYKYHEVPVLTKQDSGEYFCEAFNAANTRVQSKPINIEVHMAMWKKALIGGTVLLVVSVLVLVGCVMYFKSRRVRVDGTSISVWSERKPEADDDDENSSLSNEPDVEYTEVVHPRSADPARGNPPQMKQ
ncbi:platelet endothelial cell adhesion molecule isoform X3 [Melanotaenia boesemani]|uniref:platelet endothelial cell adhesion molecule isoform X3 n=1 Tax=Melanotaenia boesemani TaxID=1250792 RepID=UPI001C05632E|nr:platelet endothelial cell adhesion molecule isoform X3 [Melanotaenia boesemani]